MNKKNNRSQTSLNLFKLVCSLLNQKEKGFGAFAGLCVGLIIMFACTALIVKSQEDKLSSSAQVMKANSKMAAETGAHHYLDFISKYPSLMVFEKDCWGGRNGDGTCKNDPSDKPSWANPPMEDPHLEPICNLNEAPENSEKAEEINGKFGKVEKVPIGADLAYKFVSYQYDGVNTGTLTIDGFSAMDGEVEQTKHRLQIQIQIVDKDPPGLWAQSFGDRIFSKIGAHVADSSNCTTDDANDHLGYKADGNYQHPSQVSLEDGSGETGSVDPLRRPFPNLPNDNSYVPPTGPNINNSNSGNPLNIIDATLSPLKLPRDNDWTTDGKKFDSDNPGATSESTFIYHLPGDGTHSIRLNSNDELILGETGKETIKIYADQQIELNGNSTIQLAHDDDPDNPDFTKVIFFANGDLDLRGQNSTEHKTTDFQVYVYGGGDITIRGSKEFKGFIFGPDSEMFLMGDPLNPPPGNNLASGAIWVHRYALANGSEFSNFRQMLTKADMKELEISSDYEGNYDDVKYLEIGPITSWRQIAWGE